MYDCFRTLLAHFPVCLQIRRLRPIHLLPLNSISTRSAALSDSSPSKETINLSSVPSEFHDFADIFSKKKADTLAPHQPFDLKIELEEGSSPPIGRLYFLFPNEQESLQDFLKEHLNYGFI